MNQKEIELQKKEIWKQLSKCASSKTTNDEAVKVKEVALYLRLFPSRNVLEIRFRVVPLKPLIHVFRVGRIRNQYDNAPL